ncbi:MAG: hypothetical protein Salg2KO_13680 [Salibacteraceae bacterium]
MPGVTFTTSDFTTGCLITDVNVSITWAKTDGSCTVPGNGNSFHGETNFRLDGPNGTQVILASPGTWSGNANIPKRITVFDQSASNIPSGTPASGTFLPNNGNLNSFNGASAVGVWTLRAGDTGIGDPLCVESYSVTITKDTTLSSSITAQTNVSCNGGNNGSITAQGTNGTAPYSYTWSNGDTTATINNLTAGTYTVTVTDSNNCPSSISTATITQPTSPIIAGVSVTSSLECFGDMDGQVLAYASGGAGGYTFSWNTGETNATETNLGAGTYSVTITDANGCFDSASVTLIQPDELMASATVTLGIDCFGETTGEITASQIGGTSGYAYSWNTGDTNATETDLGAGTYTVTITDVNGCVDSASVTLTEPTLLEVSVSVSSPIDCYGDTDGEVLATASGGTPGYAYLWSTAGTGASETNLASGTYTVTVTDDNECTSFESVFLTQPDSLTLMLDDTVFIPSENLATTPIMGPSGFAAYLWSTGSTDSSTLVPGSGWYTLVVTDEMGCMTEDSVYVEITLGLNNVRNELAVKVFPNPATHIVNILIENNRVPDLVQIYSLDGRKLLNVLNTSRVNVSPLKTGTYMLRFKSDTMVWNKILIIEQ